MPAAQWGVAAERRTVRTLIASPGAAWPPGLFFAHGAVSPAPTFCPWRRTRGPQRRGAFDRGLDGGRGLDAGRTLGSYQADAVASHRHADGPDGSFPGTSTGGGFAFINQAGSGSGSFTGFTGGAETRPKNVAYLPIIKY